MSERLETRPERADSVHAILLVDGRYVLQLRDDRPDIAAPGLWGLFGGLLHPGEEPEAGLARELNEELDIKVKAGRLVWHLEGWSEFLEAPKRWWFFEVDGSEVWEQHRLSEGRAAEIFAYDETTGLGMTPLTREVLSRHRAERRNFTVS
jgi:8-oxo-dGTP pyrophosphatase MutT (NUDIX family)